MYNIVEWFSLISQSRENSPHTYLITYRLYDLNPYFPDIFTQDHVFPENKRIEGNAGSRVKISGKYMFKLSYNLFIPCPQDVFRKFHYKIHHDNL